MIFLFIGVKPIIIEGSFLDWTDLLAMSRFTFKSLVFAFAKA
ncbi:hypothetical protein [uncultured Dokdonia sp.]|nr:hypothetical protein [uncultured Dokdonia sp.]